MFSKCSITRFNDVKDDLPAPGAYDPKRLDKKVMARFTTTERFKIQKAAAPPPGAYDPDISLLQKGNISMVSGHTSFQTPQNSRICTPSKPNLLLTVAASSENLCQVDSHLHFEIRNLKSELTDKDTEIQSLQARIENDDIQLSALKERLAESEREIAELKANFTMKDQELKLVETAIEEKTCELDSLNSDLEKRKVEISELKLSLDLKIMAITDLKVDLEKKVTEHYDMSLCFEKKNCDMSILESHTELLRQEINDNHAELMQHKHQAVSMHSELQERSTYVKRLNTTIEAKNQEIVELRLEVCIKEDRIVSISLELDEKVEELTDITSVLEQKTQHMDQLQLNLSLNLDAAYQRICDCLDFTLLQRNIVNENQRKDRESSCPLTSSPMMQSGSRSDLSDRVLVLSDKIQKLNHELAKLVSEHHEKLQRQNDHHTELQRAYDNLASAQTCTHALCEYKETLVDQVIGLQDTVHDYQVRESELNNQIWMTSEVVNVEAKMNSEIEILTDQVSEMKVKYNEVLGTCVAITEEKQRLQEEYNSTHIACEQRYNENEARRLQGEADQWRQQYEDLLQKIAPFRDQLDEFEYEKQLLLSKNANAESEVSKLSREYGKLLGHQNQKQKIKHIQRIKDDNNMLKQEVSRYREQCSKDKRLISRLRAQISSLEGMHKFDPAKAFTQDKENLDATPPHKGIRATTGGPPLSPLTVRQIVPFSQRKDNKSFLL